MTEKNKLRVMVSGLVLAVLFFAQNSYKCQAMDKYTVGNYNMNGVKASVELGVKGNRFWINGNSTDLCDFSVDGEYIGEDGGIAIRYDTYQRDNFSYGQTLPYDILSIYADIDIVANNGASASDRLSVY